jgi:hypothetical protein
LRTQIGAAIGEAAGSVAEVATAYGVSWPSAHRAFVAHAEAVLGEPQPTPVLGIDETRRGKPRWQRCAGTGRWVRVDPWDTGFVDLAGFQGLLGQREGRTGATVIAWLSERTPQFREGIECIAIDPAAAYASAIRTPGLLPNATIVVDHFHLIDWTNSGSGVCRAGRNLVEGVGSLQHNWQGRRRMDEVNEVERDIESIRLPEWGRVVATDYGVVPFVVVDLNGRPVEPIQRFLRDFLARDRSRGSVRSYAFDLHRWWRFLAVVGVSWDRATSAEVRDFVLWLGRADKQRRHPRTKSRATAGQINPVTRKRHQDDRYQPRTIRHSNAVMWNLICQVRPHLPWLTAVIGSRVAVAGTPISRGVAPSGVGTSISRSKR